MTALSALLRTLFAGNVWRVLALAGIIYCVGLYSLVLPMLLALAVDVLLPQHLETHLIAVVAAALLLALLRFALAFVQDYEFQRLRLRCERGVVRQVLGNALARPLDPAHEQTDAGVDGWLRLWLVNFQYQMTEILFFCAYAVLISVTVSGLLFWLDPGIGGIVLLFAALHYANFRHHNPGSRRQSAQYSAAKTAFVRDATAAIAGKRAINVALLDDTIGAALHARAGAAFAAARNQAQIAASQGFVQSLLRGALYLLLVAYCAPQIIAGQMSTGSLLFVLLLVSFAYEPVYRLNQITAMANQLLANLAPLRPFLDSSPRVEDRVPDAARQGRLELAAVSCTVGTGPLFQPLTVSLQSGAVCLLKGPSGSGKTTLLDLMSGLQAPAAGTVIWAGSEIRDCRHAIYVARQNAQVFSASLADNVSLFAPQPDGALISAILRELGLGGLADDLQAGIAPQSLSLGERQRIALARALYLNPGLLLLDEPTANLDRKTERQCLAAIAARRDGRITVLVSHSDQAAAIAATRIELGTGHGH